MTDYPIRYYRPRETWEDAWAEWNGHRVNYRFTWENGTSILCNLLRALGYPDGSVSMRQIGIKKYAQFFEFTSTMHTLADHPVVADRWPTLPTRVYADLNKIGDVAFSALERGNDLLGRGFVTVVDDVATITDLGRQMITQYNASGGRVPNVVLSNTQREAFRILATNAGRWDDVHGKTQNLMINSGWVAIENGKPVLTGLGEDILTAQKQGIMMGAQ